MATLATLGDLLDGSGWTNVLTQAGIATPGTADSFLRAHMSNEPGMHTMSPPVHCQLCFVQHMMHIAWTQGATTKIVTELRKNLLVVDQLRKEIESLKSQQAQIAKKAIDTVQQQIYLSCKMDIDDINQKSEKLQSRVSDLESTNKTLHNELDDLVWYSGRTVWYSMA